MNPSPTEYGLWYLIASSFISTIGSGVLIYTSLRTQRRSVSLQENFATTTELKRVEQRVDGVDGDLKALKESIVANGEVRRKSIEAKVEAVRLEVKEDVSELHEKVNAIGGQVAAVQTKCDLTNQNIVALSGQFTRMLERKAEQ
jgi:hypothetical protein